MADTTLTWLGHSAFRLDTASGKRIYVDPFLNGNPKCPESEQVPERADIIAVTHGHGDHVGDTVELSKTHGAAVVALVELAGWLGNHGVDESKLRAPNKGGTIDVDGVDVHAHERIPLRLGAGRVVRRRALGHRDQDRGRKGGLLRRRHVRVRRHAADRAHLQAGHRSHSDRRLLHDGPERSRRRRRASGRRSAVVPCHWGTFPALTGTPDALEQLAPSGVTIEKLQPGESVTV